MIDAVVTGRSLPALQTALDLAEMGLSVVVLDEASREAQRPWAERDADGVIRAFAKRVATPLDQASDHATAAAQLVDVPAPPPLLLQGADWMPQSAPNVLGVPAVALSAETTASIGGGGAFRAYLDRLTPLLTVGKTRMFGTLVQKRMGAKVRERLVDPQFFERFGAEASQVEVAIATPGFNEALSRAGSLGTAVLAYADRNVARETRVKPARGARQFAEAVLRRLELYGVELRQERAISIAEQDDGWVIRLEGGHALLARALVADLGESVSVAEALAPHAGALLPDRARAYASMGMERPEWLESGARAIARVGDWAITLDDAFGSEASGEPGPSSSKASPESQTTITVQLFFKAAAASHQIAKLAELQRQDSVDASKTHIGTGIGVEWLRGVPLQEAVLRAAPYCTIADRDEAAKALVDLEEARPNLVVVGRAVHGDDQAAALAAAHTSAVHLRRRLLGLAE